MKHLILVLTTTLLVATTSPADDGLRVRYLDPSSRMSVTVSHDIDVREMKGIANRTFSFDLTLAADRAASVVTVTIDKAKGTYTAHDMKERLGTRHLTGVSFPLSIGDGGRRLEPTRPSDAPVISLAPIVSNGFSIAGLLADTLPVLPEEALTVGATWTIEQPIRSLQGWGWGTGRLTGRHRVTAVDRKNTHTIISVTGEASTKLSPLEGDRGFTGDLKQTMHWTFDATDGRLLSM